MNILLIEDAAMIAKPLKRSLELQGYQAVWTPSGTEGEKLALESTFDAILLDIMLPDTDGLEVLRALREQGCAAPILLMTAKGHLEDRVTGLDAGADDYLPKPFHTEELMARLRALLRRNPAFEPCNTLAAGNLVLNPTARELSVNNLSISLTTKEASLAESLLRQPGGVVFKERLLSRGWPDDPAADSMRLEAHISRLRKKLSQIKASVSIESVRGSGYRLCASEREHTANESTKE